MSLITHVRKVVEASGKKSLLGLIFSFDGLKIFADGNIGCDFCLSRSCRMTQTSILFVRSYNKVIKGPTAGTLVGTDSFGNRCESDMAFHAPKSHHLIALQILRE